MKNTLFIFILFCLSCQSKSSENKSSSPTDKSVLVSIQTDDIEYFSPLQIETLIDTLFYVFPKTDAEYRIGSFDKIVVEEDQIFIMDNTYTMSIFSLDFEGNFNFKVAAFGEGPEQYRELRDFTFDKEQKTLHVLDFGGRAIRKYSSVNGEYLESTRFNALDEYIQAFEKGNGNYFMAHANNCGNSKDCHNLTFLDVNLNFQKSFLTMDENLKRHDYRGENHFFRNGDEIFYKEVFNDTIYQIDQFDNNLKAAYFIDFGKAKIPDDIKYSSKNRKLDEIINYSIKNGKTWGIYDFHKAENSLFFNYSTPDLKSVYYDITTDKAVSFHKVYSRNPFLLLTPKSSYKDFYINISEAEFIFKFTRPFYGKDSIELRKAYPEIYNKTLNLNRDDNNILTFYKIKL